jgi:hypothetical protein
VQQEIEVRQGKARQGREGGGIESPYREFYITFEPDNKHNWTRGDLHECCLENPILHPAEEACQLETTRQIHGVGKYQLNVVLAMVCKTTGENASRVPVWYKVI